MRSISLPALHYTYIESYEELSFVCLRQDGSYEATTALQYMQADTETHRGLENFHFHQLGYLYEQPAIKRGGPKQGQMIDLMM